MSKQFFTLFAALALLSFSFWGCSEKPAQTAVKNSDAKDNHSQHDHSHHKGNGAVANTSNTEVTAAMAKLSADDRSLAEKQKVCPVSGEELGSMGAPIKIDVKGQPVFICCEGCKEELLAKPDEYLAKLQK